MNEKEYEAAVRELSGLLDRKEFPALGAPGFARADALVNAVVAYERLHFPVAPPSPEEAEQFRREQECGQAAGDADDATQPAEGAL